MVNTLTTLAHAAAKAKRRRSIISTVWRDVEPSAERLKENHVEVCLD